MNRNLKLTRQFVVGGGSPKPHAWRVVGHASNFLDLVTMIRGEGGRRMGGSMIYKTEPKSDGSYIIWEIVLEKGMDR